MRRVVLAALILPLLSVGAITAYRSLSRDYRYVQLVKLGDSLIAEELPFQAGRTYSSAIALKPDDPVAFVKRADAEKRQGNLAKALLDLERAQALSPDVLAVSSRLAEILDELEKLDEAAQQYRKILELDPDSPQVLYKLGWVSFRAGRDGDAIEALTRAASVADGLWESLYLRGAVFRSMGELDRAETDFLEASRKAPGAVEPRSALIELYLERGDASKALPLVQKEIDANPGAAQPYLDLAEVHRLEGRSIEAIEAVSLALEQNPNLPAGYLVLGELWLAEATRRGDAVSLEKAVTALESAAKMDPSNGAAALSLGRAYLLMGDESRGFGELQRASHATPIQVEAHRLLGELYRSRKNYAEAVTAYHVYLKLEGDTPAVLERLGDTYVDLGAPAMAAATYSRLAELEPGRVTPLVKAARAFLVSGDQASAIQACRRGLARNPEDPLLRSLLAEARSVGAGRGGS